MARGTVTRLIVTMPPRHGKSDLCSQYFPAWFLMLYPSLRVILGSYEAEFAASWGEKARDVVARQGHLYEQTLSPTRQARNSWGIANAEGGMTTAGVGGPITGKGADLLIIDDPIKNQEEAFSEVYRAKAWEWYQSTAYSRLEPGGRVLLIQTRWHQDDLAGRLLAEARAGGEEWQVVDFPAIAEGADILGRKEGQALWPERYNEAALARIKKAIGTYFWNALYQQRPSPKGGGIWRRDWFRYWKVMPSELSGHLQSWDFTFKETEAGSYIVGQVWAEAGANKYLLDQVRFRGEFSEALRAMFNMAGKWPMAHAKLVEEKANGSAIINTLQSKLGGIIPIVPEGSKEARAQAVAPHFEAGNVYLPDPSIAPWVQDFIEEATGFPTAPHDDQVDAASQALERLVVSGNVLERAREAMAELAF